MLKMMKDFNTTGAKKSKKLPGHGKILPATTKNSMVVNRQGWKGDRSRGKTEGGDAQPSTRRGAHGNKNDASSGSFRARSDCSSAVRSDSLCGKIQNGRYAFTGLIAEILKCTLENKPRQARLRVQMMSAFVPDRRELDSSFKARRYSGTSLEH